MGWNWQWQRFQAPGWNGVINWFQVGWEETFLLESPFIPYYWIVIPAIPAVFQKCRWVWNDFPLDFKLPCVKSLFSAAWRHSLLQRTINEVLSWWRIQKMILLTESEEKNGDTMQRSYWLYNTVWNYIIIYLQSDFHLRFCMIYLYINNDQFSRKMKRSKTKCVCMQWWLSCEWEHSSTARHDIC